MIQDLGKKMEVKVEKMQKTFNKDLEEVKNKHLEELKNKQTEMNNTITEMKNTLEGINSRKRIQNNDSEVEPRPWKKKGGKDREDTRNA